MDAPQRRTRAGQLRTLAVSMPFVLAATWLVNATHELARRGDELSDTAPGQPLQRLHDVLVDLVDHELAGDVMTASRVVAALVEGQRAMDACRLVADELEHEAALLDSIPAANWTSQ